MKNKWKITAIILISFIIFQFTGRIIPMPINILMHTGFTMTPTLNNGDILIATSKNINEYNIGDIAISYIGYMQYIAHRIVEIHEDTIIMRGDNTENLDPPIKMDYAKYKVIMIIPYEVWMLPIISITILKYRKIIKLLKTLNGIEISILFIISTLTLLSITPVNSTPIQSIIQKPSVELRSIEVLDCNHVIVKYNLINTRIIRVEKCIFKIGNVTLNSEAHLNNSDTLIIETPIELYQLAYKSRLEKIDFQLEIVFDKGVLNGSYMYNINWRKLDINVINGKLLIVNPNYIPINISNIRVFHIDINKAGFTELKYIDELNPITIDPEGIYELKIDEKTRYAYIEFKYKFFEVEVIERRQINFTK